jgi:hypothetical protein
MIKGGIILCDPDLDVLAEVLLVLDRHIASIIGERETAEEWPSRSKRTKNNAKAGQSQNSMVRRSKGTLISGRVKGRILTLLATLRAVGQRRAEMGRFWDGLFAADRGNYLGQTGGGVCGYLDRDGYPSSHISSATRERPLFRSHGCRPRSRLTAPRTAFNDAASIEPSRPTPHLIPSSLRAST